MLAHQHLAPCQHARSAAAAAACGRVLHLTQQQQLERLPSPPSNRAPAAGAAAPVLAVAPNPIGLQPPFGHRCRQQLHLLQQRIPVRTLVRLPGHAHAAAAAQFGRSH